MQENKTHHLHRTYLLQINWHTSECNNDITDFKTGLTSYITYIIQLQSTLGIKNKAQIILPVQKCNN